MRMQTPKETSHEIKRKIYTFPLVFDNDVEKSCVFHVELKLLNTIFNFSQFHKHIFRSSGLQMFFKIGAVKDFTIFRIKKTLQHRYFPV